MTLEFLNPNNYTFAGGLPVKSGRDLIIPDSIILSQTMLIKWQIRNLAKGATIDQIPPAILSTSLEIPGLGTISQDAQQIQPSQQGNDVVQFWYIDPSLPHKIKFSQVSDLVANSVLEFYSSSVDIEYMGVSNPSQPSSDPAALQAAVAANIPAMAAAIGAASGTAVQTALSNQAAATESRNSTTSNVVIKAWTGDINNHKIIGDNPRRIGLNLSHPGQLLTAGVGVVVNNTSDVLVAVGATGRDGQDDFDYLMAKGGTFITDEGRVTLPVYAWLLNGRPNTTITMTENLP